MTLPPGEARLPRALIQGIIRAVTTKPPRCEGPRSLRTAAGALILDWPKFVIALWRGRWMEICNRRQVVTLDSNGNGVACEGPFTIPLHVTNVFPSLGRRLLRAALREHPLVFRAAPPPCGDKPSVSFVIGHRGEQRLAQLQVVLEAIAGQDLPGVECIVVEQDAKNYLADKLPSWVRLVHTAPPAPDMPYNRSWAFNVGARAAGGELLVLHDNDIIPPADYARRALEVARKGYDVVDLKRFVFYLRRDASPETLRDEVGVCKSLVVAEVLQNTTGGGSLAVKREAFFSLGGFDEAFCGWGGEDNEFWQRARTLKVWHFASLPFVHLWHPPQPRRKEQDNPTARLLAERGTIPEAQRIRELVGREAGRAGGPTPPWKTTL